MKMTKRILAFVLVLMLTLSLSVPAFADGAQYKNTQAFLAAVDGDTELTCEYDGIYEINGTNYEEVFAYYSGDLSEYEFGFFMYFDEDNSAVFFNMPVITCSDDDRMEVMVNVNDFNIMTEGVKLYLNDENYVKAEMYLVVNENCVMDILPTAIALFMGYAAGIYEAFADYNVAA